LCATPQTHVAFGGIHIAAAAHVVHLANDDEQERALLILPGPQSSLPQVSIAKYASGLSRGAPAGVQLVQDGAPEHDEREDIKKAEALAEPRAEPHRGWVMAQMVGAWRDLARLSPS
jgi:hypothetical protein